MIGFGGGRTLITLMTLVGPVALVTLTVLWTVPSSPRQVDVTARVAKAS